MSASVIDILGIIISSISEFGVNNNICISDDKKRFLNDALLYERTHDMKCPSMLEIELNNNQIVNDLYHFF